MASNFRSISCSALVRPATALGRQFCTLPSHMPPAPRFLTTAIPKMTPPIAIIGAGPCGLTLARLLQCRGIDYVLYERDPASAPAHHTKGGVGGSLDLHPSSGQKALKCAGLLEEFKKHARYDATQFTLATQHADVRLSIGEGRDAPEIDRSQLRQMLLDSVSDEKIRWDCGVKALEKAGDGATWSIKFANGSKAEGFGLVVGTDGAWSKVRPQLTSSKPIYSGAHFIEGRISLGNPSYQSASAIVGRGNFAAMGEQKWLSVQQMADESYRVYMGVQVPEAFAREIDVSSQTETIRAEFLEKDDYFARWSPKLKRMIADAEGPFKPWPLYSLPVDALDWPHVPGLTLLGDAAHLTTPNGEGVNSAMYDALILAEKISEHCLPTGRFEGAKLEDAVSQYEEDMKSRGRAHIEDGNGMIDMMFATNAIEIWMQAFGQAGSE